MVKRGAPFEDELFAERGVIDDLGNECEEIVLLGSVERVSESTPPIDYLKLCFNE